MSVCLSMSCHYSVLYVRFYELVQSSNAVAVCSVCSHQYQYSIQYDLTVCFCMLHEGSPRFSCKTRQLISFSLAKCPSVSCIHNRAEAAFNNFSTSAMMGAVIGCENKPLQILFEELDTSGTGGITISWYSFTPWTQPIATWHRVTNTCQVLDCWWGFKTPFTSVGSCQLWL